MRNVVVEDCVLHDFVYTGLDCTPGPCDQITVRRVEVYGAGVDSGFAGNLTYGYLATLGNYDNQYPATVTLYNNVFFNDNPEMGGTTVFFPRLVTLDAGANIYYNPYREEDVICAEHVAGGTCFSSDEINDHYWVFYGSLSNVGYTITVTDTATDEVRQYVNASGEFGSVGDTSAFYLP